MYNAGDVLHKRYRIISLLGQGGSGCVYLAQDFGVGKLWAIKDIDMSLTEKRFAKSEILMLKSIDNHCFPRITDAFVDCNHFFIVSDYIEGISLAQLLEGGALSKIKSYKFACQIAKAIEYLHSYDPPILYLDLKPENIMIKPDGRLYLVDFGISSFITSEIGGYGTKGYAAPEQYKEAGSSKIDERADIYAFGETYLAMRTGCRPQGNPMQDISLKAYASLSGLEKKFISKCTHVDPKLRFTSMHQVRRCLDRINFFTSNPKRKVVFVLVLLALIISVYIFSNNKKDYTAQMVSQAAEYMEDGEYTLKSLSVMESYINSGLLSDKEKSYYCYVVGRVYFERYQDFREALRYFEKLDNSEYPQKDFYVQMCNISTSFDYDKHKLRSSLISFTDLALGMRVSKEKYDNLLFAAFCFEYYLKDENGGNEAFKIYERVERELSGESAFLGNEWVEEILRTTKNRKALLNEYS